MWLTIGQHHSGSLVGTSLIHPLHLVINYTWDENMRPAWKPQGGNNLIAEFISQGLTTPSLLLWFPPRQHTHTHTHTHTGVENA